MTYIPSLYLSTPQQVNIVAGGTVGIATVNINYARLSLLGHASNDFSGTVNPSTLRVAFASASLLASAGVGSTYVLVEEFHPAFFRQPFQHGTVTIPSGATNALQPHGLTLGPKAFMVFTGCNSSRGPVSPLALAESQVRANLLLNGANIQAGLYQADYPGAPGTVVCGYTLIDPK